MKISVISLFCIVAAIGYATAKDTSEKNTENTGHRFALSAYIGQKYGLGASAFFDDYATYFGGRNLSFPLVSAFGSAAKMELLPNMRFGIGGEHFSVNFTDNYLQSVFLNPNDVAPYASREISQQYSLTVSSVLLTAEYIPVVSPYRTYAGIGAGAAFGTAKWLETAHSTDVHDKRVGGQYLNDNLLAPAAALYAGVELAFDRTKHNGDLILLAIEVPYVAVCFSRPIFEKAAEQFAEPPPYWNEPMPIGASGLTLQIGLVFQFVPRRK